MNKLYILLACFVMIGSLTAYNWTDDGHGGVYWTMNNYTISAYPKTSTMTGNNFYQYVNFTSTNPNPITANLSFVFDEAPSTGAISIFRNTTTRLNATYTIIGVTNTTTSTANCSIGDDLNLYKYNVSYGAGNNSTSGIACFDSYTQSGNDYTIKYSYNNYTGWENILSQFYYTQVANHHVWTYNNVAFNGSTNYQTKFEYSFPQSISVVNGKTTTKAYNGKFDIYAHTGSPSDVVNGIGTTFVVLDPYYNSTGGSVTYDGNYTVVTYTANGTFNVTGTITNATVLVVAGGGGGGYGRGGGGGAGGLIYNTTYNASGNITVTVGLGGNEYTNGSNSVFGTLTAIGGGGAGGEAGFSPHQTGNTGGSGGGGKATSSGGGNISGQGSSGAAGGTEELIYALGGAGGGAGAQPDPSANTTSIGTNGGIGINYTINGSTVCYAGGGSGGGNSGTIGSVTCGGGIGKKDAGTTGNAGVNGTGGGGGGGSGTFTRGHGGNGGSGIVIVRYLTYVAETGNLTINATTGGAASGNNSTFTPPANLTINATASVGYYFTNWTITTGNCTLLNASNATTNVSVLNTSNCNVQANFLNATPTIQTASILPSPAYTNASLQLWCNATTADAENVTYNYTAYLNGVANFSSGVCAANMSYITKLGGYCIDQYEASRPDATTSSMGSSTSMATSKPGVIPWVSISMYGAQAACTAAGKYLCTSAQWLGAADIQGAYYNLPTNLAVSPYFCVTDSSTYCSGHSYSGGSACDTGSKSGCRSNYMVYDMIGNVWEWNNETVSTTAPSPGTQGWYYPSDAGWITSQTDTKYGYDGVYFLAGNQSGRAVLRGGVWDYGAYAGPFHAHLYYEPSDTYGYIGFRCCSGSNTGTPITNITTVSQAYANFSSMTTGITLGSYENVTQGINTNVANISQATLIVGQNWTLQCSAYNANGASAALNSSVTTIQNTTANITAISVNPTNPTVANNLTCNITVVDPEHATTNITGYWFKNGVNQTALAFTYNNLANNTNTLISTVTSGNLTKGQNWSCQGIAFDGIYYSVAKTSTNVTILNSAPTNPLVNSFVNATMGHSFTVNGSVTDLDGGTDIATATITPSIGSCVQLSNSTSGTTFRVKFNCTSTVSGTANIMIGFTDASSAYVNNSSTNAYPNNPPTTSISSVANATNTHSFTYNTTITDLDGLTDQNYTLSSTLGTCVQLSNTTNTTSITLKMNCTSTTAGTTTIRTNSTDLFGATSQTNTTNTYPDHAASLTAPTITPATIYTVTTVTCNMGVFSDIDNDTENVSARTYAWQYNGATAAGQTASTFNLSAYGANNSANVSCSIRATNSTWATSNATTYSANKTITPNYAPVITIQNTFTNSTSGHSFTVMAGANDTDANDYIASTSITSTLGSCVYVSNSTAGSATNVTYLCTGTTSDSTNITIRFTDAIAGNYNTTNSSSNTYIDHAPTLTAPTITPALAHLNDTLTCNAGVFSDLDGDTENVSARIWAWYVNGVYTAATATLPSGAFTTYDNITCTENATNSSWVLTALASSAVFTNVLGFYYTSYGNTSGVVGVGAAFDYSASAMETATGNADAFGLLIMATVFIGFYIIGSRYTQERALVYSTFVTTVVAFLLVSGNFLSPNWLILSIIALLAAIYFANRVG